MPQQQFGHVPERGRLAQRVQKMPQFGTRGNPQAPQRGLGQRGLELVDAGTQAPAVKWGSAHRATASGGIRRAAMKIGNGVAVDELQGGVLEKKVHHARPLRQKGLQPRQVKLGAQFMPQVGQRASRVFGDTCGLRQRVARNPHPATRPCRGSTIVWIFLDHQHLQA